MTLKYITLCLYAPSNKHSMDRVTKMYFHSEGLSSLYYNVFKVSHVLDLNYLTGSHFKDIYEYNQCNSL